MLSALAACIGAFGFAVAGGTDSVFVLFNQ